MKAAGDNGADLLILDTAPNADQTASLAARAADLVLIPCRAAAFDLEAIETTLMLSKVADKTAYVVLNAVPPRSGIGKEAAEGLTARGVRVAPGHSRTAPPLRTAGSTGVRRRSLSRRAKPPRRSTRSTCGYVALNARKAA